MHLMIDLETLSLQPNCVVTQIGWATFDLSPKLAQQFQEYPGIIDAGVYHLEIEHQLQHGRSMNWDTIAWWLKQDEEARNLMVSKDRSSVGYVLQEFAGLIKSFEIEGVWGNGANFDITIMEDLFFNFGIKTPWKYNAPRDCRTLAMLVGDKDKVKQSNPIKHSAKHDAIYQALWMQNCYAEITAADRG